MHGHKKRYGQEYLRDLLTPVVRQVLSTPDVSYEIDPSKLAINDPAEMATVVGKNLSAFTAIAQQLFALVFDSLAVVPPVLRLICFALYHTTATIFTDAALSAVGGFFSCGFQIRRW